VKEIKYPLTACQKMAMMRNIEKMITDALNDHREVISARLSVRHVYFGCYRAFEFFMQRMILKFHNLQIIVKIIFE